MGEKKRRHLAAGGALNGVPTTTARGPDRPDQPDLVVRPAFEADLEQVATIYHHHVMTGFGTFDIDPPGYAQMHERWTKIVTNSWPFMVACHPNQFSRVLGYAYAQPFRERRAYAQSFEDSVYVAPFQQGKGVGSLLLNAIIEDCAQQGVEQLLALIGDANNQASLRLHARAGFSLVGRLHNVGKKFGRSLDVMIMQRALQDAAATAG